MRRRRFRTRRSEPELPEASYVVLDILEKAEDGLSWEELRARAADVGIDEEELCLAMFGTKTRPEGYS